MQIFDWVGKNAPTLPSLQASAVGGGVSRVSYTNCMDLTYPYLRTRHSSDSVRIEVMADSMRVGKTTAVKVIAQGLRKRGYTVTESYEDWEHNPYLKQSYSDPAKNFLESQKWFIRRKFEQIRDGANTQIFIQDVSPEMDYCYAETNRRLGRMGEDHFVEYDKFYRNLDWSQASAPDLLVYLQVSDDVLIQRAMDSAREFETVEANYFLMMKKVNMEWVSEFSNHKFSNSQMKILKINTDKLDFAHDERAKQELVAKVIRRLDLV